MWQCNCCSVTFWDPGVGLIFQYNHVVALFLGTASPAFSCLFSCMGMFTLVYRAALLLHQAFIPSLLTTLSNAQFYHAHFVCLHILAVLQHKRQLPPHYDSMFFCYLQVRSCPNTDPRFAEPCTSARDRVKGKGIRCGFPQPSSHALVAAQCHSRWWCCTHGEAL